MFVQAMCSSENMISGIGKTGSLAIILYLNVFVFEILILEEFLHELTSKIME